jgi:exo-beta-1,3-glucanase (GH17 family)
MAAGAFQPGHPLGRIKSRLVNETFQHYRHDAGNHVHSPGINQLSRSSPMPACSSTIGSRSRKKGQPMSLTSEFRPAAYPTLLISLALLCTSAQADSKYQPPSDQRQLTFEIDGQWIGNAICYGPHRDGQHPDGAGPTREQIEEDIKIISTHWRLLRMYATGEGTRWALETIRKHKLPMRLMVGCWIAPETRWDENGKIVEEFAEVRATNRRQVANAIKLANEFPELVWAINVGNETQVSWSSHKVHPQVLLKYIRQARSGTKVPVSTADDFLFWDSDESQPFAGEVDFVLTHIYAMWRGQQLENAVPYTQEHYAKVKARFPHHPTVMGEAGWATMMHTEGDQAKYIQGKAGEAEQLRFVTEYLAWTSQARITNFMFEAFDEKWKGGDHPNEVEKHWGLYYSNRKPKPAAKALQRFSMGVSAAWIERVRSLNWICYSPTNADPERGVEPPRESVIADLKALRELGFNGLITYACSGIQGRELPTLAAEAGFEGLIPGVWDPQSEAELAAAIEAARQDVVLGVCIGNEGLGRRYSVEALSAALAKVRSATGKPVTTTEEIDDYIDDRLMNLGDWVFPNAHPVYHHRHDQEGALRWTVGAYNQMRRETGHFVWFKEVGIPTAGHDDGHYSPVAQEAYYRALAASPVMFAYFEAFDLFWKSWRELEMHWGLFTADREPKAFAQRLLKAGLPDPASRPRWQAQFAETTTMAGSEPFWIYRDDGDDGNHYHPTGRLGDCGDVHVERDCHTTPFAGKTCIHLWIKAEGAGPNNCDTSPPCRWAGLRWLHPARNWGRDAKYADAGFDLSGYACLRFFARSVEPALVRFHVGGIDTPYGDSLAYPAGLSVHLTPDWREYTIDLRGCDLGHVISAFGVTTNWDHNPDGVELFLDDIRLESRLIES